MFVAVVAELASLCLLLLHHLSSVLGVLLRGPAGLWPKFI
jgi:UPF0716 family protein affecting phage T7 exclusion